MLRSVCVSRRVLLALAATGLLLFLLHRSDRLPAPWLATAPGAAACGRVRNPYHVAAPPPLDRPYARQLWGELRALFDAHPPSPRHLEKPRHVADEVFPTPEQLGTFFNLTDDDASASRAAHERVRAALPAYPARHFRGRGVVVLAGGRYSEFAATALGVLRDVGSRLPVEVWAKDAAEELPGWCNELAAEGMSCRRLADHMDVGALRHAYQWKVFTILFSGFREVLFLDADAMPVGDPDAIFESPAYRETGAVLWPDYWKHSGSPALPYILGLSEQRPDYRLAAERSVESGQLLWDKGRHWRSLLLAAYYNYHGPDFFYTLFNNGWAGWGDKDTFPMALKAAAESYYPVTSEIRTIFLNGTVHGVAMLHDAPPGTFVPPTPSSSRTARLEAAAYGFFRNAPGLAHQRPSPSSASAPASSSSSSSGPPSTIPLFLHANIIKWSMRDLACDAAVCSPLPWERRTLASSPLSMPQHPPTYHRTNPQGAAHAFVRADPAPNATRLFHMDQLAKAGVDPEPLLWRSVEHAACRSPAWRAPVLCGRVRKHMARALGMRFVGVPGVRGRGRGSAEWGTGVCVVEPGRGL